MHVQGSAVPHRCMASVLLRRRCPDRGCPEAHSRGYNRCPPTVAGQACGSRTFAVGGGGGAWQGFCRHGSPPSQKEAGRLQAGFIGGLSVSGFVDRCREAAMVGRPRPERRAARGCICLVRFSVLVFTLLLTTFMAFNFALRRTCVLFGVFVFRSLKFRAIVSRTFGLSWVCSVSRCIIFFLFVLGTVGPTPPPLGRRRVN